MIPFSHPHDSKSAGLRDYRARVEGAWHWPPDADAVSSWYRAAFLVAMALLIVLLAFLVTGCAWHYPPKDGVNHLDAIHPSRERIAQLAIAGLHPVGQSAWLRLSSPFVLAGGAVRLTCFLPESRDHRYLRLSLIDVVSELRTVTHATQFDELLIESVPCGSYAAVCESLANSNRVLVRLERPLTSRGSCNAEGDR